MTNRHTAISGTEITYHFHLIFDEGGSIRITRAEGDLSRGERTIAIAMTAPRSLWRTPSLQATINIGSQASADIDLAATVEAVRHVTGLDIDMRIIDEGEKK